MMSSLDVNGISEGIASTLDQAAYINHDDLQSSEVVRVDESGGCSESSTYPSPTSTISPGIGGSPHAHDTPPASVPISRSSELAYALQSQPEQVRLACAVYNLSDPDELHGQAQTSTAPTQSEQIAYSNHSIPSHLDAITTSQGQYFYPHETHSQSMGASGTPMEYMDKYHYDPDFGPRAPHEQYDTSANYLTDAYNVDNHGELGIHHQHMGFQAPNPDVYDPYGDVIDPSMVSPLDNPIQNVETFVTYA